jgi:ABC transporter substrate binding protein
LPPIQRFARKLQDYGYVEGQNVRLVSRFAEGHDERYPAMAVELAELPVDLIVTWGTPAALAAKQATRTIPVVMGAIGDPVSVGIVSNLVGFPTTPLRRRNPRSPMAAEADGAGRTHPANEALAHGIRSHHEDDRDCRGCGLCGAGRLRAAGGCYHGHLSAHQFGGQRRQSMRSTFCPAVIDADIAMLDIASSAQAAPERMGFSHMSARPKGLQAEC